MVTISRTFLFVKSYVENILVGSYPNSHPSQGLASVVPLCRLERLGTPEPAKPYERTISRTFLYVKPYVENILVEPGENRTPRPVDYQTLHL